VERLVDTLYLSLTRCISITPPPRRPLTEEIALPYPEDCRDPLRGLGTCSSRSGYSKIEIQHLPRLAQNIVGFSQIVLVTIFSPVVVESLESVFLR
jgi:hypothetical protein